MKPPVLSIVDYGAWEKGYMPPSEHVLIDQLSYRGAKVVQMSDWGTTAWWLVIRGARISGKQALAIRVMIETALEEMQTNAPDTDKTEIDEEKPND